MKFLQSKRTLSTVLLSCSLLFTVNASANEASLEKVLTATLQAQGQKVVHDLSAGLANSIRAELQKLSMRHASEIEKTSVAKSVKSNQQKQQTSEE